MTALVGKPMNLVLDGGAVTGPNAFNHASEHGRAIEPTANQVMGGRRGVRHPAGNLPGMHARVSHEGEDRNRVAVARLLCQHLPINRSTIQARWRPRLQAALRQPELFQTV